MDSGCAWLGSGSDVQTGVRTRTWARRALSRGAFRGQRGRSALSLREGRKELDIQVVEGLVRSFDFSRLSLVFLKTCFKTTSDPF